MGRGGGCLRLRTPQGDAHDGEIGAGLNITTSKSGRSGSTLDLPDDGDVRRYLAASIALPTKGMMIERSGWVVGATGRLAGRGK